MKKLRSILKIIQEKILSGRKILSGASFISLLGLFGAYFFGETTPHDMCVDIIYTSAYSTCTDGVIGYFNIIKVVFIVITVLLPVVLVFVDVVIRKRFFKFLKWYTPIAIVIGIVGHFAEFCLMWSCSSMLGAALALDLFVLLAFLLFIGWSVFRKKEFFILVLIPVLIIFSVYVTRVVVEKIKSSSEEINRKASQDGANPCSELKHLRERDHCLFIDFQCEKIVSSDMREECFGIIQRNQAVSVLDINACDRIIGQQRSVCRSLIKEAFARGAKPPSQEVATGTVPN